MNFKNLELKSEYVYGRFSITLEKTWCNYIRLNLYHPTIFYGKDDSGEWLENFQEYGIKGESEILFMKTQGFKTVSIILLGFGISIDRQNGY